MKSTETSKLLRHSSVSNKLLFRQLLAPSRVLTSPPDSSHLRPVSRDEHCCNRSSSTDLVTTAKKLSCYYCFLPTAMSEIQLTGPCLVSDTCLHPNTSAFIKIQICSQKQNLSIGLKLLNLCVAVVSRGENNKKQQNGAENQAHSSPVQALYFTNCSDTKRQIH